MAANVRPGRNENGVVTEPTANVNDIKKEWSVIEDGALAHRLQEEENVTHYSGNISRRRTVRSDIKTAKSAADEEALQAFREEHEIAEKNRQIEQEDAETAKKLLEEMMEEEKQKMREQRQRENEERDREAAKKLYYQMMEEEKRKQTQQKTFQETDAELALRLQAHEEKKQRVLSQRHRSAEADTESERLARHLAREEKMRSQSQREQVRYNPADNGIRQHRRRHFDKPSDSRVHREGSEPTDHKHHKHKQRQAEQQQTDRQRLPESREQTGTPQRPTDAWEYLYKEKPKEGKHQKREERTEHRDAERVLEPQPPERRKKQKSPERRELKQRTDSLESRDKSRKSERTEHRDRQRAEYRDTEVALEPQPPERRKKQKSPERRELTSKQATDSLESRKSERIEHRDRQRPEEPELPLEPPERRKKHRTPDQRNPKDKHAEKAYLMPNVAGLRVAIDEEPVPELPRKHKPQRVPRQLSAPAYAEYQYSDSDEETDVIAKIQDDEELARRLQREEIQRSRAPSQLSEQQRKQLIHDKKIAIKMQHEEVMFSKKSTYDNYMGKVKNEVADPEPMVHVSRQNKTAVPADAKYAMGVQLTDYTAADVAQQRRTSGSGQAAPGADGNIIASIDPTFNRPDPGNVVLLKKTTLEEEPLPPPADDSNLNPVQGSKRRDSKDKGKRGSIFSKLKKK